MCLGRYSLRSRKYTVGEDKLTTSILKPHKSVTMNLIPYRVIIAYYEASTTEFSYLSGCTEAKRMKTERVPEYNVTPHFTEPIH